MYQQLTLVGHLGRDPEMRYTPQGTPVTNFNLATSRVWVDNSGQRKEETAWFRVAVYGKQAENVNQYLSKGSKVLVAGVLIVDPSTGGPRVYAKRDGTAGASFEVRADTVRFLSSKNEGASAAPAPESSAPVEAPGSGEASFGGEEILPF